ncbi:MAG: 3-oxoacid CoA-transferase subunit B [Chloroflexota bacterium]
MVTETKLQGLTRDLIALRASREIKEGNYVNLGIGIPTLVSNWTEGRDVVLHSEIGLLDTGPLAEGDKIDQDCINASCQPVQVRPTSCCFDIAESFAMMRGGHMDVVIIGALQVSEKGDLAGWFNPSRGLNRVGNIGGSMDLCAGSKKLIATMEHTTKNGEPKIVRELTYPATARGVVNLIVTDLAVIEVTADGLVLKEVCPGITPEEVQSVTEPKLIIAPDLKEIEL